MYDSNQLNSYHYAQMQSSILNITSQSKISTSGGKINLNNKFATLKLKLNEMEV